MIDKSSLTTLRAARRYPRLSTNIAVRAFHGAKYTPGRGHDIGLGGMAIYVPIQLAIGSSINLSIQLPASRMVLGLRAVVRNSDGFRYGVEFVDLTSVEAEEIRRMTNVMEKTADQS